MIRILARFLLMGQASSLMAQEDILPDPVQEELAREIMKGIRCLVCQNQSVDESDADLARDMRQIIRDRVAMGDDAKAVEDYLVARYGEWVLLKPPFQMRTALLWFAPLLFMLVGGMTVFLFIRGRRTNTLTAPDPLSAQEENRINAMLQQSEPDA